MAGLTGKDKEALVYLYELNEFKSFKRWCTVLKNKAKSLMTNVDMRAPGASETIAGLQGQIHALENIDKAWAQFYKKQVAAAKKEQKR